MSLPKGHNYCIGAVSTATAAGLSDWLIKMLGRWSSNYMRTPESVVVSGAIFFSFGLALGVCIRSHLRLNFSYLQLEKRVVANLRLGFAMIDTK